MILKNHFILFVDDQQRSTEFYSSVLNYEPHLNVPGMTEFELSSGSILGLMPAAGIRKLLGEMIPDPAGAKEIPRAELYLLTGNAQEYLSRALAAGAKQISSLKERDWAHRAAYVYDPDNHIVAFAEEIGSPE